MMLRVRRRQPGPDLAPADPWWSFFNCEWCGHSFLRPHAEDCPMIRRPHP